MRRSRQTVIEEWTATAEMLGRALDDQAEQMLLSAVLFQDEAALSALTDKLNERGFEKFGWEINAAVRRDWAFFDRRADLEDELKGVYPTATLDEMARESVFEADGAHDFFSRDL